MHRTSILERLAHRALRRPGMYLSTPKRLKWAAKAPVVPRLLLHRVSPPTAPWPVTSPGHVPEQLRGEPGVRRDEERADQAFGEAPVPHFTSLHRRAIDFVFAHLWMSILPTAPQLMRANKRAAASGRAPVAVAPNPHVDLHELTLQLKEEAGRLGMSAVGVAPYDARYAFGSFQGQEAGQTVIVCVLEQNYEATNTAPSVRSELAVMNTYSTLVNQGCDLATWLNGRGFRAKVGDPDGHHIYIHYGVQAGLGQLGLNGQLLTRQAGSRCRLILIETDAPLVPDTPADFGIPALCDACKVCVRRCPSGAIPPTRKDHRGVEKAKIRTDRCLPLVAQVEGCAVCMRVCPVQKYGLDQVMSEFEATGQILGKGTDALEGYYWPPDDTHYGPDAHPKVDLVLMNPPTLHFDPHQVPDPGAGSTAFE